MSPRWQKELHIEDDSRVVVTHVKPDGPADVAGIKKGDIILSIDRNPVENVQDFQ